MTAEFSLCESETWSLIQQIWYLLSLLFISSSSQSPGMMLSGIVFLLLACSPLSWCQYDLSNVVPGTRMSVNDDMFVSASNAFSNFAVIMHPFRNATFGGPSRCNMRYNTTDRFVHSVAVVGIARDRNDSETFMFVFAAERISTTTPHVCIGTINNSTCVSRTRCTNVGLAGIHQEYFLIGVDTNGTFAFGFTSTFVFKLDIYANQIVTNLSTDDIWPASGFIPHGLDVADTWAVVAGYGYTDAVKKNYAALGCYINLTTLINSSCVSLVSETTFLIPSNVVSYDELYELSVAIRGQKILVGVHRLESIVVLRSRSPTLTVLRVQKVSYPDALSFGRVVDWADDTTIAVLVLNPYQISWSKSQIFAFDELAVNLTTPIFTFPNNQQVIGARLSRPSFARFGITAGGNMAILTGAADILIVPISPAGYVSTWVETLERVFVFYYQTKLCIGGTYKNRSSLGSCQICPPQTRNPGTCCQPILECIPCSNISSTSLCPLAALADLDSASVPSYSQAVAYPETAETTNIEDILIKNMFQLSSERRCLVISPLLWTLVVSGVCLLVLAMMLVVKVGGFQRCNRYRKKVKNIFKHTDIIGEGEMWAGGLATLAILVLVSFSYWFSASFIKRYPIEQISEPAAFACDDQIVNAQFSTGLVLLSLPKSADAQIIFDLLDGQPFNLTVELINTGFGCNTISTQENLVGTKYVPLPTDCLRSPTEAITSVTVAFPSHRSTVQFNMTGPHWIGAIRVCIRGDGQKSSSNTLKDMDFCQNYSTRNEAIGRITTVPIVLIKNINMTQALQSSDPTEYSGIWLPTFGYVPLSDEPYYVENGNYLRYTSSSTILQVILDERPFFIKNIQQPIVRTAELIFHGLLFTSLCIELFAFSFLITKLLLLPLTRWVAFLWKTVHRRVSRARLSNDTSTNASQRDHTDKESATWKVDVGSSPPFIQLTPMNEQKRNSATDIDLDASRIVCRF